MQAEVRLYDRLWKVENPRDELAAIREAKNCDALEAMKDIINPRFTESSSELLHREVCSNPASTLLFAVPTNRLLQH